METLEITETILVSFELGDNKMELRRETNTGGLPPYTVSYMINRRLGFKLFDTIEEAAAFYVAMQIKIIILDIAA